MFYLVLRLLYEDFRDGLYTKEDYLTAVERLANLHEKHYHTWQDVAVKYTFGTPEVHQVA